MLSTRPSHPPILVAAVVALLGAGAAAGRPGDLKLPPDLTYNAAPDAPGPVVFSHQTHVALADNKCLECHPAPFRMLRPRRKATHTEMEAGRLCGVCHDGKTASGLQDDCEHCHKPPAAAPKRGGS